MSSYFYNLQGTDVTVAQIIEKRIAEQHVMEKELIHSSMNIVNRDAQYLINSAQLYAQENNINEPLEPFYREQVFCNEHACKLVKKGKKRKYKPNAKKIGILENKIHWPLKKDSFWISSKFGWRSSGAYHFGIDLAALQGTLIMAAGSGVVVEAAFSNKGYGNTVVIAHEDGMYHTRYAHLKKILVKVGQKVAAGHRIGLVGDTGFVRGENCGKNAHHLHFEVKRQGKHINPLSVLPRLQ
jgi:murein DD-endopeptidase MepM/ murein hydrolase activator NlpD